MNEKHKTNLVCDGEEVSLFVGELDSSLGDGLHGPGHVVIPGDGDISHMMVTESHDDMTGTSKDP